MNQFFHNPESVCTNDTLANPNPTNAVVPMQAQPEEIPAALFFCFFKQCNCTYSLIAAWHLQILLFIIHDFRNISINLKHISVF